MGPLCWFCRAFPSGNIPLLLSGLKQRLSSRWPLRMPTHPPASVSNGHTSSLQCKAHTVSGRKSSWVGPLIKKPWSTEIRSHCLVINENTAGFQGGHLFLFCSQAGRYSSYIWPLNFSSPHSVSTQPPEDTDHVFPTPSHSLRWDGSIPFLPALLAPVLASST